MRKLVIFILVMAAVFYAGKMVMKADTSSFNLETLIAGGPATAAKSRVKQILEGLQREGDGGGLALQAAVCRWDSDLIAIQDQKEFEEAYDAFQIFLDQRGINHRKIAGYDITGAEVIQEKPPVVIVSGTIEGKPFKLKVPEKRRLIWMD
jgi:hypothetical protein